MKTIALLTTILLTASPAIAQTASQDAAVEGLLRGVGNFMTQAGYPGTGRAIATGTLGTHTVETAFDICQERALGKTDNEILTARVNGSSQSAVEDFWFVSGLLTVTQQQGYCEAIGADQYVP